MSIFSYKRLSIAAIFILSLGIILQIFASQTTALSGSQFNAANIIDPTVFFSQNSMNAGDIQNFLNAKVPTCDTNGSQMHSSGQTRAAYGASVGEPAPYICLKDYTQSVPSKGPDAYCSGGIAGANKTAAQIIFDVSQACGISPKVLIVLLQKEQSLVTDDWPWDIQYRSATGYGCPDTAPCDAEYYGFFNQVYNAARQFQRYVKQPNLFNFAAGRTSNIQYNPNTGCGSSAVGIQNGSTAALYNYTPYQPNAAALANLYGTGDSCSAYGNRNFWRMFNDWFGSTHTNTPYAWQLEGFGIYSNSDRTQGFTSDTTVAPGGKVYIRVRAANRGNQAWSQSNIRFGTTYPLDRTSQFYDATWFNNIRPAQLLESSVQPGEVGTFEFVLTAPQQTGQYKEHFNMVAENITWFNEQGSNIIINVVSPTSANTSNDNVLESGATLQPKQYLLSPDSQSVLVLQEDGNLVLYANGKAVWNSVTFGRPPDHLEMGVDGNLVIYFKDGSNWSTTTFGNNGATLKLQTDGNLVLYNSSNTTALWNTVTFHTPDHLSYVITALRSPGVLYKGQQLETADRRYRLAFQQDGNLVLYSTNRALWSANTHNRGSYRTVVQADGNLVIYDSNGHAVWNTQTFGRGSSQLIIQQDGNLVLYDSAGRASWNTVTFGQF